MSYIGNSPTQVAFITDTFSGNGSTTVFTMSVAPANSASALVAISGVVQDPSTYSVSGTTLTFSAAPPTGTGNISVRYLGIPASNITTTAYRTVTEFTATAGQTTFTPASYVAGFLDVYRNGVKLGSADFTATNGTTVVLAVGATSGDLITTVGFYVSSVLNAIPAQAGSVVSSYLASGAASQAFLDVTGGAGTGAMLLPVGTTAQRPTGQRGLVRLNSTTGNPEWYDTTTSSWLQFSQPAGYLVNYLVVAGGGGGGCGYAGGGGAGGLLATSTTLSSGTAYTITVGSGGSGSISGSVVGTSGSNSVISSLSTAIGGGGGGSNTSANGISGGSGGGGSQNSSVGGNGTSGQGYAGGNGAGSPGYTGGGGGGAGAAGTNGTTTVAGNGGVGVSSSISGSATSYAGGGGGGCGTSYTAGSGGSGGGGAGTASISTGTAGTANTGGGGGGGGSNGSGLGNGGNGGSGIVIISYLGSQRGTGGTVTSSGGYTIHTFTSSGTYNA